jgi:hypothetical protein
MNLPRIAVVEQASFLVILSRGTNLMTTAVTDPPLLLDIQIEIFRDPDTVLLFG